MREQCTVSLETNIKAVEGGHIVTITERFVNGDHTVLGQAVHTKICTNGAKVADTIDEWYVNRPKPVPAPLSTPPVNLVPKSDDD